MHAIDATGGAVVKRKVLGRLPSTRYDKLALTYRGGVVLNAIITWSQALGDTP
jgi:hypothetical protein